jgi:hypothetical protein
MERMVRRERANTCRLTGMPRIADNRAMSRLAAFWLVVIAVVAAVATAGSTQVVRDPSGDADKGLPDIVRATARTVGTKIVIVFTTKKPFVTHDAPALSIQQPGSPHPWFIGGQSNGEFLGGGPGDTPRANVTRPSSRSIRYSFSSKRLRLKKTYKWFGEAGLYRHMDRVPDKGWITSTIG